ncbi:jg8064, partial [Pararge aegeria aegeria]
APAAAREQLFEQLRNDCGCRRAEGGPALDRSWTVLHRRGDCASAGVPRGDRSVTEPRDHILRVRLRGTAPRRRRCQRYVNETDAEEILIQLEQDGRK